MPTLVRASFGAATGTVGIDPARNAPAMKCRPDPSAPKPHAASQIRPAYQRSRSGIHAISLRNP
ncbi:MAG TPA: hypothetical protein VIM34_02245 [Burkholderiaceae bacterium]